MRKEIFLPIVGFEDRYQIGNQGTVISNYTQLPMAVHICNGYQRIGLYRKRGSVRCYFKVHRLVASAFISNPNKYPTVNHIDCNKLNNAVSNLEWTTNKKNIIHAFDNGLCVRNGVVLRQMEKINRKRTSKRISLDDRIGIKRLMESGLTLKVISAKYNISIPYCSLIANDKT